VIGPAANVLADRRNPAYLNGMVQPVSAQPHPVGAPVQGRVASVILWSAASSGGLAVLAAGALWFHYGTAVFFEMIAAGIAACF